MAKYPLEAPPHDCSGAELDGALCRWIKQVSEATEVHAQGPTQSYIFQASLISRRLPFRLSSSSAVVQDIIKGAIVTQEQAVGKNSLEVLPEDLEYCDLAHTMADVRYELEQNDHTPIGGTS